ncbi:MAG: peptide-methionine (S)-S-oxide reductase, partial [Parvibaculales bacterium]
ALYLYEEEELAFALSSRDMVQDMLSEKGFGGITTEIKKAPVFYYAEEYHQQYLAKNPDGYCSLSGTGIACELS